jgi:hypothetical protein
VSQEEAGGFWSKEELERIRLLIDKSRLIDNQPM